jgi:hypothetical protein
MSPDPFALPAFIMSIVSLIVAVIGAATGIAALVWQIVTRTRGAHRVRVELYPNTMFFGAGREMGPFVRIEIINRGAAPVQVRAWGIDVGDGNSLVVMNPAPFPPSPDLPFSLELGSSQSFFSSQADLKDGLGERDPARARAFVHLATGQVVHSKRRQLKFP